LVSEKWSPNNGVSAAFFFGMLLCIVSLVCILVVFFMDYTSEVKEGIVIKKRRKID
jgi:uncharacterized membrane protein YqiK